MSDVVLQLWEFDNAPADLRRLVREDFTGGWLALISADDGSEFALHLVHRWSAIGTPPVQYPTGNGRIVMAGPHPDISSKRAAAK